MFKHFKVPIAVLVMASLLTFASQHPDTDVAIVSIVLSSVVVGAWVSVAQRKLNDPPDDDEEG